MQEGNPESAGYVDRLKNKEKTEKNIHIRFYFLGNFEFMYFSFCKMKST